MGMDLYTFIGVYFELPKGEILIDKTITGCKKCKTTSSKKFCENCGNKIGSYEKKFKVDITLENLIDIDEFSDFDGTFTSPEYLPNISFSNSDDDFRFFSEDEIVFNIDPKVVEEKLEKARNKYASLLETLKEKGFDDVLKYGVIFYYA